MILSQSAILPVRSRMVLFHDLKPSAAVNILHIVSGAAAMSVVTTVWRLKNFLVVVASPWQPDLFRSSCHLKCLSFGCRIRLTECARFFCVAIAVIVTPLLIGYSCEHVCNTNIYPRLIE